MFCKNCGQELRDGAKFCTSCGAGQETVEPSTNEVPAAEPVYTPPVYDPPTEPTQPTYTPPTPVQQPPVYQQPVQPVRQPVMVPVMQPQGSVVMPVLALIMGILAIVFCWVPFLDFVFALLALIFGCIGLKKRLKGMAIAGLVIGIIFLIISIIWTIAAVAGVAILGSDPLYAEIFEDAFRSGYSAGRYY